MSDISATIHQFLSSVDTPLIFLFSIPNVSPQIEYIIIFSIDLIFLVEYVLSTVKLCLANAAKLHLFFMLKSEIFIGEKKV